jgi:hypothetical protein
MVLRGLLSIMTMQQGLDSQFILLDCFQIQDCALGVSIMGFVMGHFIFHYQGVAFVLWRKTVIRRTELSIVSDHRIWQANPVQ